MFSWFTFRDNFKAYKNRVLKPHVEVLNRKFGITSNMLSVTGLIFGIIATFFLFENNVLFTAFILLALGFDILDGSMAKVENKKGEGWIIDVGIDRIVTTLLFGKTLFYFDIQAAELILVLFLLVNVFLIYERLVMKRELKMLHIDPTLQILYIFKAYAIGIYVLGVFYFIGFILMLIQLSKFKKIKKETTWANMISAIRVPLLIYGLWALNEYPFLLAFWIILIFLLDALDGIVAREIDNKSNYGAYVDIAADRLVELIILFVYAFWGMISWIFPVVFLFRGMATDFLRVLNKIYKDEKFAEPLSIGKADNRFIRGLYGFIKLAAFSVILVMPTTGLILLIIALIMNLFRGLPVIFSKRSKELLKRLLS